MFCFGDEGDLMEMVVLKWAFKNGWRDGQVQKRSMAGVQPSSLGGQDMQESRRETPTSYDVTDQSSSIIFPTLPVILGCPFGDERFYYCSSILIC